MPRPDIDLFVSCADEPGNAIRGLTSEQLNAFPIPGTWSIQQIVLHLLDSDLIACGRFKRIAAMNTPTVEAYDESAFTANLHYDKLDPFAACELFRLNRLFTGAWLRILPDEAFDRAGIHEQRGRTTLFEFVRIYTDHVAGHMKHLYHKRRVVAGW